MNRKHDDNQICEIVARVCDAIEGGARSVAEACRIIDVPRANVLYWIDNPSRFGLSSATINRYARARATIIDRIVSEIDEIASGESRSEDTAATVARDRLRIDSLKWHLSKLMPKTLGDKMAVVGGNEDDEPIKQSIDLSDKSDEFLKELAALRARNGDA